MARQRELKVVILGDATSAQRALGKLDSSVNRTGANVEKAQSRLSKFGPQIAAGAAIGGAALLKFSKGAIAAASESRKVEAQTRAAIRSTGGAANVTADQVAKLSSQLQKLSGVEDEAIQSGANMLLTFTNIRNETGRGNDIFDQATRTLLDMSVALGTDAKSSAIQLGKALNDPIRGVTALSRVGVQFTADQRNVIRSLVETGDVAGAQRVILAELNREFGGSAKAAGDAQTATERLKIEFGELQEKVGGVLIDRMEDFARGLQVIGDWEPKGNLKAFLDGLAAALALIARNADDAYRAIARLVGLPGKAVKTVKGGGPKGAALRGILKGIPGPIGDVFDAIPGFEHGGVVPGRKGAPQLAVVHGGERVIPNDANGGGNVYNINVPVRTAASGQEIAREVAWATRGWR